MHLHFYYMSRTLRRGRVILEKHKSCQCISRAAHWIYSVMSIAPIGAENLLQNSCQLLYIKLNKIVSSKAINIV